MKKTYLYHLVAGTVLLMHLNPADAASDSYIKERAKGWFWYETKTEPESISETDTDTLPQLSPVPLENSSARKNAGNIIISSRPAVHSGSDSSLNKPQELRNRHSGIAAEIRLSSDIRRLGEKEIDAYLDKLPRAPDGSLHAGDLRLILPRVLELAVDHPDEANITRYFSLQQMSMNKSENFAKTARELVMFNTELDEMPGALKSQQQKETDIVDPDADDPWQVVGVYYRVFLTRPDEEVGQDTFGGLDNFNYRVAMDGTVLTTERHPGWYSPKEDRERWSK